MCEAINLGGLGACVRRDGVSGGSTQRQTIQLTGETLFGPADGELEVAVVPMNFGKTEGREGPLLSSSERNRERQPDCPR